MKINNKKKKNCLCQCWTLTFLKKSKHQGKTILKSNLNIHTQKKRQINVKTGRDIFTLSCHSLLMPIIENCLCSLLGQSQKAGNAAEVFFCILLKSVKHLKFHNNLRHFVWFDKTFLDLKEPGTEFSHIFSRKMSVSIFKYMSA